MASPMSGVLPDTPLPPAPPRAALKRTGSAPAGPELRNAAAHPSRRFEEGAEVELWHTQEKKWQPGVIEWRREETGVSWHKAEGWKRGWARHCEAVQVVNMGGEYMLDWDENCAESLPEHFWKTKLRLRRHDVYQPSTRNEAMRFVEEQTLNAAKVLPRGLAPNDHVTEALEKAHRRTEALLQVGAPRPPPPARRPFSR